MSTEAYGYCHLACIPMRREPDLASEMISQVLFAETFEVLETRGHYVRVRLAHDAYEGWLDRRQTAAIEARDYEWMHAESPRAYVSDLACAAGVGDRSLTLLRGSPLPGYRAGKFVVPGQIGWLRGEVSRGLPLEIGAFLDSLETYLHAPYLWGGRSPLGIDCSGLVQMAFRPFGVALPRDSCQQREQGEPVANLREARPSDLAFFASEVDGSSHVGLVLPDGQVMHAAGSVRIDRLDDTGIHHAETGQITHRLTVIKRVVDLRENDGKST